jgi:hypothetical protein
MQVWSSRRRRDVLRCAGSLLDHRGLGPTEAAVAAVRRQTPRLALVVAAVWAYRSSGRVFSGTSARPRGRDPVDAMATEPATGLRPSGAATHNSMGAGDIADWMFPNQQKGIRMQLEDGIRGFLIDVHYGVPVGDRIKTILDDEVKSRAKYEEARKEAVEAPWFATAWWKGNRRTTFTWACFAS